VKLERERGAGLDQLGLTGLPFGRHAARHERLQQVTLPPGLKLLRFLFGLQAGEHFRLGVRCEKARRPGDGAAGGARRSGGHVDVVQHVAIAGAKFHRLNPLILGEVSGHDVYW
jgi:hypothetical protein